ncbi:hypothetical protein JR050_09445 [Bacillus sp. RD4P76]|uniref:DUF3592 domain-containing protein n=2 Tax=Bacillus suaedaesalsae TaxID=2810349 RepID=A0ABS2DK38_9BACI|nr:hypothetical protein [Bacillus suaedaesalsae]MBM6617891.1 hypothetical protein [Bacillus suaedaesalsae]
MMTVFSLVYVSTVSALSWAYIFVVNDGRVYEVLEDSPVSAENIDKEIGEVKTRANDYNGRYYGNASNYYDKGTKYYKILDVPLKKAIAVEVNPDEFVKAEFVHDAPFHLYNLLFNNITKVLLGIVVIGLGITVSVSYKNRV